MKPMQPAFCQECTISDIVFHGMVVSETETFKLGCPIYPHIPRQDGGHFYIRSKEKYFSDRTDFSPREALESMHLAETPRFALSVWGL